MTGYIDCNSNASSSLFHCCSLVLASHWWNGVRIIRCMELFLHCFSRSRETKMMNEFLPVRVHCVDLDGIEQLRHAVNAKGGKLSSWIQIQFNALTKERFQGTVYKYQVISSSYFIYTTLFCKIFKGKFKKISVKASLQSRIFPL